MEASDEARAPLRRPLGSGESKRRGRPPGSTREQTRARVVAAARVEFAEHGYAGTSMRAIASAAGVTGMALYNYAASKAELFEIVFVDNTEHVYRSFADAIEDQDTFAGEVDAIFDRTRDLLRDEPDHLRFPARLVNDRAHPDLQRLDFRRGAHVDFFTRLRQRWVSRGEMSTSEAAQTTTFLFTLLWGVTATATLDPSRLDQIIEASRSTVRRAFGHL